MKVKNDYEKHFEYVIHIQRASICDQAQLSELAMIGSHSQELLFIQLSKGNFRFLIALSVEKLSFSLVT